MLFFSSDIQSPNQTFSIEFRDNRTGSKGSAGNSSIQRTRKEKFRHALRSVSKVAFSQLGLGQLIVMTKRKQQMTSLIDHYFQVVWSLVMLYSVD